MIHVWRRWWWWWWKRMKMKMREVRERNWYGNSDSRVVRRRKGWGLSGDPWLPEPKSEVSFWESTLGLAVALASAHLFGTIKSNELRLFILDYFTPTAHHYWLDHFSLITISQTIRSVFLKTCFTNTFPDSVSRILYECSSQYRHFPR